MESKNAASFYNDITLDGMMGIMVEIYYPEEVKELRNLLPNTKSVTVKMIEELYTIGLLPVMRQFFTKLEDDQ